jgi:hypothetical protein
LNQTAFRNWNYLNDLGNYVSFALKWAANFKQIVWRHIMQMSFEKTEIQLEDRKSLAFHGARNFTLECTSGWAWVTVEGFVADFVLAKGESLQIESDGLGLIQGMPSCSVHMANIETKETPRSIPQESHQASHTSDVTFGGASISEIYSALAMLRLNSAIVC